MMEHQLSRGNGLSGRRRLTMTPEARRALLDYYGEELALLREIEQFAVQDARRHRAKRPFDAWRIPRHIRAVEMAIKAAEGELARQESDGPQNAYGVIQHAARQRSVPKTPRPALSPQPQSRYQP
jgi:hypothetical protein